MSLYCSTCEVDLEVGYVFCANCGTKGTTRGQIAQLLELEKELTETTPRESSPITTAATATTPTTTTSTPTTPKKPLPTLSTPTIVTSSHGDSAPSTPTGTPLSHSAPSSHPLPATPSARGRVPSIDAAALTNNSGSYSPTQHSPHQQQHSPHRLSRSPREQMRDAMRDAGQGPRERSRERRESSVGERATREKTPDRGERLERLSSPTGVSTARRKTSPNVNAGNGQSSSPSSLSNSHDAQRDSGLLESVSGDSGSFPAPPYLEQIKRPTPFLPRKNQANRTARQPIAFKEKEVRPGGDGQLTEAEEAELNTFFLMQQAHLDKEKKLDERILQLEDALAQSEANLFAAKKRLAQEADHLKRIAQLEETCAEQQRKIAQLEKELERQQGVYVLEPPSATSTQAGSGSSQQHSPSQSTHNPALAPLQPLASPSQSPRVEAPPTNDKPIIASSTVPTSTSSSQLARPEPPPRSSGTRPLTHQNSQLKSSMPAIHLTSNPASPSRLHEAPTSGTFASSPRAPTDAFASPRASVNNSQRSTEPVEMTESEKHAAVELAEKLSAAVQHGHVPKIHVLSQHAQSSVAINLPDSKGQLALISAVGSGNVDLVLELLLHFEGWIDLNVKNKEGQTALHLATSHLAVEIIALLLAQGGSPSVHSRSHSLGANMNSLNQKSITPAQEAAASKSKGSDVDGKTFKVYQTFLMEGIEGLSLAYPKVAYLLLLKEKIRKLAEGSLRQESKKEGGIMKGVRSALVDASRIGSSGKPLFNRAPQPQQQTNAEFSDEDMYQILSMHESKERQNKSKFATLTTPLMFSKSGGGGKFLVLGEDSSTPFSDIARSFSACALKYFQQIHKVVNYFDMVSQMSSTELSDNKWMSKRSETTELIKRDYLSSKVQLVEAIETSIKRLNTSRSENPCFLTVLGRVNTSVSALQDYLAPFAVDPALLAIGSYPQLMRRNVLQNLSQKSTAVFFASSQVLTLLSDISSLEDEHVLFGLVAALNCFLRIISNSVKLVETVCYLEAATLKSSQQRSDGRAGMRNNDRSSILFDSSSETHSVESVDQKLAVTLPGTIDELIERSIPNVMKRDGHYSDAFIWTFPRFCKGNLFVNKLQEKWVRAEKAKPNFQHRHIAKVLLEWTHAHPGLIDDQVRTNIRQFVAMMKTSTSTGDADKILAELDKKITPLASVANKIVAFQAAATKLMTFDPSIIAEQFTIIDIDCYKNLKPLEFLDQAWSKPKLNCLSRSVIEMMDRINNISYWVATSILLIPELKERKKMLAKIIATAQYLRNLNNYNSLMGILVGLNMSSVQRLKHTFHGSRVDTIKDLEDLFNPMSAFKNLREHLQNEELNTLPVIPYIGMTLTDITFLEEGNPDTIQDDSSGEFLINFPKHFMIYNSIHNLLKYQKNAAKYDLSRKEPQFTFLFELPLLHEDDLYHLSLTREPRDFELKDIL